MTMEKQNVVQDKRTPEHELTRPDENWDKDAAAAFKAEPHVKIVESKQSKKA